MPDEWAIGILENLSRSQTLSVLPGIRDSVKDTHWRLLAWSVAYTFFRPSRAEGIICASIAAAMA